MIPLTCIIMMLLLRLASGEEVNVQNSPQFWPRLIRVSLRHGASISEFKNFLSTFGSRPYVGDPSPKKLIGEESHDLELVDESSSLSETSWIELAVPGGQEEAWVALLRLNPDVAEVTRLSFATRGANPEDMVPFEDIPADAPFGILPLPNLSGTADAAILDEIDRFMRTDLIPGQHPEPDNDRNFHPSARRIFSVTDQRNLFMRDFWQQVVYDFKILHMDGKEYLELVLQAKVAPGIPPEKPPAGTYRPVEAREEIAALKEYRLKLENQLMPILTRPGK